MITPIALLGLEKKRFPKLLERASIRVTCDLDHFDLFYPHCHDETE
jgi:hypothetical protein